MGRGPGPPDRGLRRGVGRGAVGRPVERSAAAARARRGCRARCHRGRVAAGRRAPGVEHHDPRRQGYVPPDQHGAPALIRFHMRADAREPPGNRDQGLGHDVWSLGLVLSFFIQHSVFVIGTRDQGLGGCSAMLTSRDCACRTRSFFTSRDCQGAGRDVHIRGCERGLGGSTEVVCPPFLTMCTLKDGVLGASILSRFLTGAARSLLHKG